jgi:hypothetical protein
MDVAPNLILPLRVGNDLLAFEPELLRLVILGRCKLVMRGSAAKTTFLRSIGTIRILSVLKIEADFVKTLFRNKVVLLPKVTTIDDRIN